MDKPEARKFLGKLYTEGDLFEVAYIQPAGRVARVTRPYVETPECGGVIDEMERAEQGGYNVYVSVLPVSRQASRSYDRVWVDQDNPEAPWPFGADPNWERETWPKPTTLVKTSDGEGAGFRWQAIWRLSSDLPEDEARGLMKRLARLAGADGSVHDPRRVLRVPGVFNVKRQSMARLIDTADTRWGVDSFDLPEPGLIERLINTPIQNPSHVLGEWLEGVTEGDRARKAYVAARFLKSCAVDINDAASILKLGAIRSNPVLTDEELMHAVKSAYNRKDY